MKMKLIKKLLRYALDIFMIAEKYNFLLEIIKENNFKNYVEVGVWKGKTLFGIADGNKHLRIWGIDEYKSENYNNYTHGEIMANISNETYDKIKQDILNRSSTFKNITIITENSLTATKRFSNNSLDIVFIDASHDYKNTCNDIRAWLPKVRKGGILCGHDFNLRHFSVVRAVGDLIGYDNIMVKKHVSTWLYRK